MKNSSDNIPEHLQCPICFELPESKVFQCSDGHILCEDCYSKIKECPQCRTPFGNKPIRNRAIEGMVADLKLESSSQAKPNISVKPALNTNSVSSSSSSRKPAPTPAKRQAPAPPIPPPARSILQKPNTSRLKPSGNGNNSNSTIDNSANASVTSLIKQFMNSPPPPPFSKPPRPKSEYFTSSITPNPVSSSSIGTKRPTSVIFPSSSSPRSSISLPIHEPTHDICRTIGYLHCSFRFPKSDTANIIRHLQTDHQAIIHDSNSIQLEIADFTEIISPSNFTRQQRSHKGHWMWTPLKKWRNEGYAILILIVINPEKSLIWTPFYLNHSATPKHSMSSLKIEFALAGSRSQSKNEFSWSSFPKDVFGSDDFLMGRYSLSTASLQKDYDVTRSLFASVRIMVGDTGNVKTAVPYRGSESDDSFVLTASDMKPFR